MRIAAAHLANGDVPVVVLPSDEAGFDDRYRGPRGPERIPANTPRASAPEVSRVITFMGGGYRCWNNTTLVEIEERA